MITKILAGVILLLIIAGVVLQLKLNAQASEHRKQVIRYENWMAEMDSTHHEILVVKDQEVAVASRLALQRSIELEGALARAERAEGLEAMAQAQVALLSDSLAQTTLGTVVVDEETEVIVAHGELDATDSLGVMVEADVEIQTDPPLSTWNWLVVRPTMEFSLTMGCQGTAASAHLVGPPWADFNLFHVEQDPRLCNPIPRPRWQPFKLGVPSLLETLLLITAGAVLENQLDIIPDPG